MPCRRGYGKTEEPRSVKKANAMSFALNGPTLVSQAMAAQL
jgi:hypothetical protein